MTERILSDMEVADRERHALARRLAYKLDVIHDLCRDVLELVATVRALRAEVGRLRQQNAANADAVRQEGAAFQDPMQFLDDLSRDRRKEGWKEARFDLDGGE